MLSGRQLRAAQPVLWLWLSPPGVTAITASSLAVHFAMYRNWSRWAADWTLATTSATRAASYIALVVVSVLWHEIGHVAFRVANGDVDASCHAQIVKWRLVFVTYSDPTRKAPSAVTAGALAGVYFQFTFAAVLASFVTLRGATALRPSVFLIDCASLLALVPMPGTDGARFLMAFLRIRDIGRDVWDRLAPAPAAHDGVACDRLPTYRIGSALALFLGLYLTYVVVSSALLVTLLRGWIHEIHAGVLATQPIERLVAATALLAPPIYLTGWGWARMRFFFRVLYRVFRVLSA